jgi:putative sigma-54 modulation protein
MRIEFVARNEEITQKFKDHAEPRIKTLAKHVEKLSELRVTVAAQRGWYTVELTADADGQVFRAEERSGDDRSAFDKAIDRVERQLVRSKHRATQRHRQPVRTDDAGAPPAADVAPAPEDDEEPITIDDIRIVRSKSHALKPMTPEEAVLQMEQVHHDFYVFINGTSSNVAVVYRRRDGGYGLIEPDTE